MNKKRTRVKLIKIDDFKNEMKVIEDYASYINETLKKLENRDILYLEDINKCIEFSNNIKEYASCMANGKEEFATLPFVLDTFNEN